MSLTVLVFRPSFIIFTLCLIEYWERERERAKGSMKNRGQEDIKWDMKDEEGWQGGGEKEWRHRTKSCTFQCRLSPADDTTWQTNECAFNNLSTLLNALPLFLLPSLSLSPSSFHLSSSHPPPLYRSPSTAFLVALFPFSHFSMLLWQNKNCCTKSVKSKWYKNSANAANLVLTNKIKVWCVKI